MGSPDVDAESLPRTTFVLTVVGMVLFTVAAYFLVS